MNSGGVAVLTDERHNRNVEHPARVSRGGSPSRAPEIARVAFFFDPADPAARQAAGGAIAFSRVGDQPPWDVVLGDDFLDEWGDVTPAALRDFVGVIGCLGDAQVEAAVRCGSLPVVGVSCSARPQDTRSLGLSAHVAPDEDAIAALAVQHLVACGFMSLAFVTDSPEPDGLERSFVKRAAAARRSCQIVRIENVAGRNGGDRRSGEPLSRLYGWLESQERPLGVCACDDLHGRLVIKACRQVGCRVPDDVAVVGVGNNSLVCEASTPPLSSVDVGLFRIGEEAARTLGSILGRQRSRATAGLVQVKPAGFVARRSSDTLAIADEPVAEAMRFIRGHAATDLSIDALAARVALSRSSLDQRFLDAIGLTVHQAIVQERLAECRRVIGNRELSLKQVATACGFGSVSYMTTFLKRHLGLTPGQLREGVSTAEIPAKRTKRSEKIKKER